MAPCEKRIKIVFVILWLVLLALLLARGNSMTALAEPGTRFSTELVRIETRPGVTLRFILIKPDNPVAALVLLEGGPGKLPISVASGKPVIRGGRGFLVRSREDLARHGFMVALLDAPSGLGLTRMSPSFRASEEYALDLKAVASHLGAKSGLPIWLVGMSLGSFSASNGAIRIGQGIHGLVLISSVTRSDRKWPIYASLPDGILSMGLDRIMVPTLIVVHEEDECPDTPPSFAPKIKEALKNAPRIEIASFRGGRRPRVNPRSPAPPGCQPLTQHGYYGIEDQVISVIADFIKSSTD